MNTSAFGVEKGTNVRVPSTANLMVDSADRFAYTTTSPWDFSITKKQNLINGYFTRIGVTEVVLDWGYPNVSSYAGPTQSGNNIYKVTEISGVTLTPAQTVTLPDNNYTVEEVLDTLVSLLNAVNWAGAGAPAPAPVFSVGTVNGQTGLLCTRTFKFLSSNNSIDSVLGCGLQSGVAINLMIVRPTADLRPYVYIDFVCDQLTAVQDVKDTSTQQVTRDVLTRWYFDEDTQEGYDGYGFPIFMGYKPFRRRRIFNPPKQIKWEQNFNVGNLKFSVYDNIGNLLPYSAANGQTIANNWRMTLQLSEV